MIKYTIRELLQFSGYKIKPKNYINEIEGITYNINNNSGNSGNRGNRGNRGNKRRPRKIINDEITGKFIVLLNKITKNNISEFANKIKGIV